MGAVRRVPEERIAELAQKLAQIRDAHDFEAELLAVVVARAERAWDIVEQEPDRTIDVQLESMTFTARAGDRIALNMTTRITVTPGGSHGRARSQSHRVHFTGSPIYIDSWIQDEHGFAEKNLNESYRFLAENIVIGLSD